MSEKALAATAALAELVMYDRDTGAFTWKSRVVPDSYSGKQSGAIYTWNKLHAGKPASRTTKAGYQNISATGIGNVLAHRLAYFMIYGVMPLEIDHINGNRSDNRSCNLRSVTRVQNSRNRRKPKNNTTGFTGIVKHRGAWQVRVGQAYIGRSKCIGRAIKMRREAISSRPHYTQRHGL